MFGFITFLGLLALSTAIDPDNICILLSDGSKIVDDTNCAKYYTCKSGKATSGTCADGYFFSKDTQSCQPKSQVKCLDPNADPCAGVSGTQFVSMAGSCSGYYYCNNGAAIAGYCQNNLNFNPTNQKCEYSNVYPCSIAGGGGSNDVVNDADVLCAYVQNGIFFGSAASCKTWLKCTSAGLSSGSCGDYVFNVQTQTCVYANTYNCQQLNGDATQTGGSPLATCTQTDSTVKVADPDSCRSYLTCFNKKYVRHLCNSTLYFDTKTGECVSRLDAVNECDRCEGTSVAFVNAYDDDCVGYFTCSNGRKTSYATCGDGLYFDEKVGGCVRTPVKNPACLACSYTSSGCATSTTTTVEGAGTTEEATTEEIPAESTAESTTEETTEESTTEDTTIESQQ